ncbi:MAG: Lrp/AsnC ligand binding domain-containing protein [Rhodospirillales bacterium]
MQTIFILVKCALGEAYKVADDLVQDVEQVSEVHSISGQHDLLVKCYLSDEEDIGHFVTARIQRLNGIRDTFTITAYKAFG